MKQVKQMPTLDQPVNYQIKVSGHLDESRPEWIGDDGFNSSISDSGAAKTDINDEVPDTYL